MPAAGRERGLTRLVSHDNVWLTDNVAAPPARVPMVRTCAAIVPESTALLEPVSLILGAGLAVIVVACLLAAWVPAARAAKVDPIRALRQD